MNTDLLSDEEFFKWWDEEHPLYVDSKYCGQSHIAWRECARRAKALIEALENK
jgi:hypothetical protein